MVMHGGLFSHRDLAISANPWGSTFCSQVRDGLTAWGGTVGFYLLGLQATTKEPQAWTLLFLLQLHSGGLAGSSGLEGQEDVIFTNAKACH